MKAEKGPNLLSGKQIRSRKNSRIIIRILGLSIAIFGIFAFIGFVNSPVFGPSSTGTWIYLLTALLFGGGLFTLSFFVPKLYLPSEAAKAMRTDPSANRSAELRQKADSEFAAIEGTHTGVLHEPASAQEHRQTYFCARCKKQLAEQDCVWIGNHRFCRDCAKASEHIAADTERYRDPKFAVALKTSDQSPLPNPPKQENREIKCSRCGRDMPDPFHMIKDDGYRLCDQCLRSLKSFSIFYGHFEPCPQYQADESLYVYASEDRYVLLHTIDARRVFSLVPFGFFAKSNDVEITDKLNSIAPDGFGIHMRFRLSADDIKKEGIRALIEYDRSRLTSAHTDEQKDPWLKQDASAKMPPVEGIVLPFHTDAGEQMTFRLVAVQRISYITGAPGVGYARSSWIFFSYAEEAPYLLEYEYTSEWYPEWFAFPLSEEDVVKIKKGPPQDEQKKNAAYRLWDGIAWEHGKKEDMVRYLHPDDIDAAKRALYPLHTWYRTLTDEDIRGGGPLDRHAPEQEKENDG